MITAFDKNTALILIDLQKGIVNRPAAHPVEEIVAHAAKLIDAFHEAGLPVVIVHVNPFGAAASMVRAEKRMIPADPAGQEKALESMLAADFFSIVPEIEAHTHESDIRITKTTWNAFAHTDLDSRLRSLAVTGIVLGGVSTSIGVESTARTANEQGYNITFATDAMTDGVKDAHENSLRYIFPRIGELGITAEIIGMMKK